MSDICAFCGELAQYRLEQKYYDINYMREGHEIRADYCKKHFVERLKSLTSQITSKLEAESP